MGGKSRSSQSTSNQQSTYNIVNDGDYAGVGGNVTHDESRYEVNNDIDNSVRNDIDNSVENDIDNSVENDIEIDNSIENDGTFAGVNGNVTVLDGGVIEKAFDFGEEAIKENSRVTQNAINEVSNTATSVVDSLVDSQRNAFNAFESVSSDAFGAVNKASEKTLETLENVSTNYATGLGELSNSYAEGLSTVQLENSENTTEQLATIAQLAKSTALQGQDIVAENSTKLALYFGGAFVLVVLGVMYVSARGK